MFSSSQPSHAGSPVFAMSFFTPRHSSCQFLLHTIFHFLKDASKEVLIYGTYFSVEQIARNVSVFSSGILLFSRGSRGRKIAYHGLSVKMFFSK